MKSLFPILLLMSLSTLTFANNSVPVTIITASVGEIKNDELHVKAGTVVYFSGASSYDPDGGGITCYWWWKNGTLMLAGPTYTGIHLETGTIPYGSSTSFTVKLQVMDNENTLSSRTITVYVVDEERNYFVTDHLGNVRATVNQNGDVIGYDDYYPYGQVMPGRSSNTANANDIYKFTGHERDAELGLDYMLARNYDPEIGRFLSVDPLYSLFPSITPFSYSFNNPILFTDPTGMSPEGLRNTSIASTHTDSEGNVLSVYDDGDLNVYRHEDVGSAEDIDRLRDESGSTSGGGKRMGRTLHIKSFKVGQKIDYDDHNFGGKLISKYLGKANRLRFGILHYAWLARGGRALDVKSHENVGGYVAGDLGLIVSPRDVGNIVAGQMVKANPFLSGSILAAYGLYNYNPNMPLSIIGGGATCLAPVEFRFFIQRSLYLLEDEVSRTTNEYGASN